MENVIKATAEVSSLEFHEQEILKQCVIQSKSIVETGKMLKAIKDGNEYSERGFSSFSEYMDNVCGNLFPFKATQAYKYIRVYESYGPRLEQYSRVSLEILDIFRELPADELEQLSEENNLERMSVKEAAELKKQLAEATEQISLLQSTVKNSESTVDRFSARIYELEEERDNIKEQLEEAENRPVDVVVKEPDPAEIERIVQEAISSKTEEYAEEVKSLQSKIADLEKQANKSEELDALKAKYEKKLEKLQKQAEQSASDSEKKIKTLEEQVKNASKADEQLAEFKVYFKETQETIGKFVGVLNNIEDAEKKEKFRGAAIRFLDAVREELGGTE